MAISVVLLDNRNPVKQIAWIVCLIFLPIIGLIFYFFLGRDYRKKKFFSYKGLQQVKNSEYALGIDDLEKLDVSSNFLKTAHLLLKNSDALLYSPI